MHATFTSIQDYKHSCTIDHLLAEPLNLQGGTRKYTGRKTKAAAHKTQFVPGASRRGWPRFCIEASFRTIMNFPLTSSDYARPRGSTKGHRIRFLDIISWSGRN